MGAVAGESNIAARAPDLGSDPFGRTCFDNPGVVPAGDARQRCLLHRSSDIFDVARIDRGGDDPHQYRSLVGGRRTRLRHLENRGIAEGFETYRAHGLLLQIVICMGDKIGTRPEAEKPRRRMLCLRGSEARRGYGTGLSYAIVEAGASPPAPIM